MSTRKFVEVFSNITISDPQDETIELAYQLRRRGMVPTLSLLLEMYFQVRPPSLHGETTEEDLKAFDSFIQACINSITLEDVKQWMAANKEAKNNSAEISPSGSQLPD